MKKFNDYEGRYEMDTHIRLTKSMLEDNIFKSLENNSKVLYMYFKHHAKGNKVFVFDTELLSGLGMYEPDYKASVNELIKKGFIKATTPISEDVLPICFEFTKAWLYIND